ncbi:unnamed protein product, partial [Lymnaea stagnalis]
IICSWCQQNGNKLFTLGTSAGIKAFCSEVCFTQCRRASFKKNKVCDWCKHVRHTVNFVDFQDGDVQLQFCSEKCLNQYKMNVFCTEARQHLQAIQSMAAEEEKSGEGRNEPRQGEILITPELWMSGSSNGELNIKEECRNSTPNYRSSKTELQNHLEHRQRREKDRLRKTPDSKTRPASIEHGRDVNKITHSAKKDKMEKHHTSQRFLSLSPAIATTASTSDASSSQSFLPNWATSQLMAMMPPNMSPSLAGSPLGPLSYGGIGDRSGVQKSSLTSHSSVDPACPTSTSGLGLLHNQGLNLNLMAELSKHLSQQFQTGNLNSEMNLPPYLTNPALAGMFQLPFAYTPGQVNPVPFVHPPATHIPTSSTHSPSSSSRQHSTTQPLPVPPAQCVPPITILVPYPVAVPVPIPVPIPFPVPIAPEKLFAYFREKEESGRPATVTKETPHSGLVLANGRESADSIMTLRREIGRSQLKAASTSPCTSSSYKHVMTPILPYSLDLSAKASRVSLAHHNEDEAIDLSKMSTRSDSPRRSVDLSEKENTSLLKRASLSDSEIDGIVHSQNLKVPRIHIISEPPDPPLSQPPVSVPLPPPPEQSSYSSRRSRILDAPSVPKKSRSPSPERRYIRTVPRDMVEAARRRGLRARVRTK